MKHIAQNIGYIFSRRKSCILCFAVSDFNYLYTKMEDKRMRWKGRFEFVFASFGYTIGLGNLWRFPQKCYSNGGGVFLIPYLLCVILCTIPTLFLEFSLGQITSVGCIKVWKFSPLIQGVGFAIWFNLLMTVIYYNVLLMYALYYMLVSFVSIGADLPWSHCRAEDSWSTDKCRSPVVIGRDKNNPTEINQAMAKHMNETCISELGNELGVTPYSLSVQDFEKRFSSCKVDFFTPEEEYWTRLVLGVDKSSGFDDLGAIQGRNVMMLLTVWMIVYYCCIRGIRSIAKVVYITATFPFALLFILLLRGVTLDGHNEGIKYYMKPDWEKLADLQIWSSGATQAIYSLGVAFGTQISLASHNQVNNNVLRDAIVIGIVNSCISIFGGFVIFSFLGHASLRLDKPIDQILDNGPGILFISYVQGISKLPAASFWSFLFFLTVLTFGLDTEFMMVWTLYDSTEDLFPTIFKKRGKWILIAACLILFVLSLPHVTEGGIHLVMLMERYTSDFTIVLFVILETAAVCWIYDINHFIKQLEGIIGRKPRVFWWFWKFTWMVSCPVFAVFILIASAKGYTKSSYAGVEVTPGGEAIGWLLIITPLVIMISYGSFQIWKRGGVKNALKPVQDPSTAYSEPDLVPEVDNADMRLEELNRNFHYRAETHINGSCNTDNGITTQDPMYDSIGIAHVEQDEVDSPPPLQCDSLNRDAPICFL